MNKVYYSLADGRVLWNAPAIEWMPGYNGTLAQRFRGLSRFIIPGDKRKNTMLKARDSAVSGDTIAIAVVSFGNEPQPLTLPVGSTVAQALAAAGIVRGSQEIFVSGEVAADGDVLEGGDVLSVITPKQAGC